jgi:hypothetical protein
MSILPDKKLSRHLTSPDPTVTLQASMTFPGMAHLAGTGPRGLTCRECEFWDHRKGDYSQPTSKGRGAIKPAPCKKFQQLMRGQKGKAVPDDALACRHFVFNQTAPTRFQR